MSAPTDSALAVAPGSVPVDLSCSCGAHPVVPVHSSILVRWADIFRRVHSGPGHVVSGDAQ